VTQRSPRTIVVVDYDPSWPLTFASLRAPVWDAVRDVALAVEHVGSTAVPGLAAKPIIDIDVIVSARAEIRAAVDRLAAVGYVHQGNLGIEGREAFESPAGLPAHHLYVCVQGSAALINRLTLRDYLRGHPDRAAAYGQLKKQLAAQFPTDIDKYGAGKTDFVLATLRAAGH
jgi:GrpB-like predicted nucleotidyltransferase (UPF0157 family)